MRTATISRAAVASAIVLGATALAGCGGSSKGLIPTANAGTLQNDFANVEQFVSSGDCAKALGWIHQAQLHLAALPSSVNAGLRAQLALGIQDLATSAVSECAQNVTTSTTTTSTTSSTSSSATTSTSATTTTTTSSVITTTTTSSPIPSVTPGNNGGTPPIVTTTATATFVPGGGQGQGNGQGNGSGGSGQGGNGAGGVGAP